MNFGKETITMKEISISNNIADLRKKKGITQEQLSEAMNVSCAAAVIFAEIAGQRSRREG